MLYRTDSDLAASLDDPVLYEMQMFVSTARKLSGYDWDQDANVIPFDERVERNAYLESFAVHMRNICEFLYNDRQEDDDIRARSDFAVNWSRRLPPDLKPDRERANKKVEHVTWGRVAVRSEDKSWDFARILSQILSELSAFADELRKSRPGALGKRFEEELHRSCQLVMSRAQVPTNATTCKPRTVEAAPSQDATRLFGSTAAPQRATTDARTYSSWSGLHGKTGM